MKNFVSENKPGNDFPTKGHTGFSPDPGRNIVLYRKTKDGPYPVFLIDSNTGNVDIRDADGETLAAFDAVNKSFSVSGVNITGAIFDTKNLILQSKEALDLKIKETNLNLTSLKDFSAQMKSDMEKKIDDEIKLKGLEISNLSSEFEKNLNDEIKLRGFEIARLKEIQDLGIRGVKEDIKNLFSFSIGSILSVVDNKDFALPDGWTVCEGQDVKESRYHKLGFGEKVPDMRSVVGLIGGKPIETPVPGSINLPGPDDDRGTLVLGWKHEKKMIRIN
jgi:uncharacterized protein YeeX (DUF496 family)